MPKDDLLQFRIKPKKKTKRKELGGLNPTHFNIGFYLLVPILLGLVVGIKFDDWFDTKPLFVFLFLVLGVISSFYNLWKLIKEEKNAATH